MPALRTLSISCLHRVFCDVSEALTLALCTLLRFIALPDCANGKHSRICTLPVSRELLSYIADTPWSGCYPYSGDQTQTERNTLKRPTVTNNDRRSRRLTVMRMLRQNTRAPSPRRLRDRLHARSTLAKVGFLACLHPIYLERSRFRKTPN